jgi:hypothetical protein
MHDEHPFDAVARAGADGLSRRQMLKASVYGAAGVSVGGTLVAADKAWAAAPAVDCKIFAISSTGPATLAPCSNVGRGWPSQQELLGRLNKGDALKLAVYAAKNGYRPVNTPAIVRFVTVDGSPSMAYAALELSTGQGVRATLFVAADVTDPRAPAIPFILVKQPRGRDLAYALIIDPATGQIAIVDSSSPLPTALQGSASRVATTTAQNAIREAAAASSCVAECTSGCVGALRTACTTGSGLALCTRLKTRHPAALAACAGLLFALCSAGLGQVDAADLCQNYICGPLGCGECPPDTIVCGGFLGLPACISALDDENCGFCGNECTAPKTCRPLGGGVYACKCPQPCPPGQPQDPTTCECACPSDPCPGVKFRDPTTCECVCPAVICPADKTGDPDTCECVCIGGDKRCTGGQMCCTDANNHPRCCAPHEYCFGFPQTCQETGCPVGTVFCGQPGSNPTCSPLGTCRNTPQVCPC